jgi:hypothetical protein
VRLDQAATSKRSDVVQADIAELKHNVVAMVRAAKVPSVPIIATIYTRTAQAPGPPPSPSAAARAVHPAPSAALPHAAGIAWLRNA